MRRWPELRFYSPRSDLRFTGGSAGNCRTRAWAGPMPSCFGRGATSRGVTVGHLIRDMFKHGRMTPANSTASSASCFLDKLVAAQTSPWDVCAADGRPLPRTKQGRGLAYIGRSRTPLRIRSGQSRQRFSSAPKSCSVQILTPLCSGVIPRPGASRGNEIQHG